VDGLGFQIVWEHRYEPHFPVFMELSRDGMAIYLTQHAGDGSVRPGINKPFENPDVSDVHGVHPPLGADLLGEEVSDPAPMSATVISGLSLQAATIFLRSTKISRLSASNLPMKFPPGCNGLGAIDDRGIPT
jgi:hypothetical protein